MPKSKKESKSKKEKKEKSHKEKKEKHSSKSKDDVMEVDVISPVSLESTPAVTPVKTKSEIIVHYDLRALIPFAQPLASEELTREIMKVVRKGDYMLCHLIKDKLKGIVVNIFNSDWKFSINFFLIN
jgi:hypothetical protein